MIYSLGSKKPLIKDGAFIAPSADIIGDVTIYEEASVWFRVVARGDKNRIEIGPRTNVQDGTIIHIAENRFPCIIEEEVTIGHNAVIHAAFLRGRSFVGMSATVMDGAEVERYGFVAAGALVPPGMKVESGILVAGVPAKPIRKVRDYELEMIKQSYKNYAENGKKFLKDLKEKY